MNHDAQTSVGTTGGEPAAATPTVDGSPEPPPVGDDFEPKPKRGKWTRRLRRWGVFFGILVGAYLLRGVWCPSAARWLDVSERPRKVDVVLVLGGGADSRPFAAAALWKKGYARRVLLPAVKMSPEAAEGLMPSETEICRKVLVIRGVAPEAIEVLEGTVDSTFDEAASLSRYLDAHPNTTVAIVTTDWHTRRARTVFRKVLGERAGQIYFVGIPPDRYGADDWWKTEEGFTAYTSELLKSVYYAIRY